MAAIRLYDDLVAQSTNAVTTGGTWTYTGTPLVFPAAPAGYNDLVDFTGFAVDIYEYTYTVTPVGACAPVSSTLDVDLRTRIAVPNDECLAAYAHSYTDAAPQVTQSYIEENLIGSCEDGLFAATLSVEALPALWPVGTNADVWYKVSILTSNTVELLTVVSATYGADNIQYPYITIYSGSCGALVEEVTGVPSAVSTVQASVIHTSVPQIDYFIRVGCDTGNEGKYNITINIT